MTMDWTPLDREMATWQREGLHLPLWWRDDDAVDVTAPLDLLHTLSQRLGLPVHLAIIPAHAQPALAARVRTDAGLIALVHGWAHQNHAPADQKKAEFGAHRALAEMVAECGRALDQITTLCGPQERAMFVPPWNRMSPDLVPQLAGLGYGAVSTFTPRDAECAAPGLARINTHLDPIDWRGARSLADPDRLIAQVATQLAARRSGQADADEPYGILTHHLVHDPAIWSFTQALVARLLDGPGIPWTWTDQSNPKGQET